VTGRTLASRDRVNRLLDAYGALLTRQQQQVLGRYYGDDLSLGEIGAQLRISRQAVHDGLRRALAAMERLEAALGLVRGGHHREPAGEHYFAAVPRSVAHPRRLQAVLRGRAWTFHTLGGVFAMRGIDAGTRLLIDTMRIRPTDRTLDLGCGYGAIGLVAASLAPRGASWLVDVNRRAAAAARANAVENRLPNARVLVGDAASAIAGGAVDVVATNPPIRAGRLVVRGFVDDAWRVLRPGGRFYLVARTAQGARTLGRLIAGRFGAVQQVAARGGYRVFVATRRPAHRRAEGSHV
jgi:16S rRNA (guanine1207-N2)-methyltransferase